jgi:hypothetical protein
MELPTLRNDSQLAIEIVRGSGGHSLRIIGFGDSFPSAC